MGTAWWLGDVWSCSGGFPFTLQKFESRGSMPQANSKRRPFLDAEPEKRHRPFLSATLSQQHPPTRNPCLVSRHLVRLRGLRGNFGNAPCGLVLNGV